MPSFSRRVYWLAGLLLGIGNGSLGRFVCGEEGGERVSTRGCFGRISSELERLPKREPGAMAVEGRDYKSTTFIDLMLCDLGLGDTRAILTPIYLYSLTIVEMKER